MKKLFVIAAVCMVSACASGSIFEPDEEENRIATVETQKRLLEIDYVYDGNDDEAVPAEFYSVLAARTTNKMLDNTADIYEKYVPQKLYIANIKKEGAEHIPDGFFYARTATREIIDGTKTYVLVETRKEADYVLEPIVKRIDVQSLPARGLQYKLILKDKEGKEIGAWAEDMRQVQNDDKSWW